jgi:hypothetical protein
MGGKDGGKPQLRVQLRSLYRRIGWAVGEQIAGKDKVSAPETCGMTNGDLWNSRGGFCLLWASSFWART